MDDKLFLQLLKEGEGPTLDYKAEQYRLGDTHGKACLVKDILCMANTPRESDSYILIGARKVTDQVYEPVDVADHPDDSRFQDIVKGNVHPIPRFTYHTLMVEGKRCGALVIKPVRQGPSQAPQDMDNGYVRRRVTYWRRGSQNDEARPDESVEIHSWCNPGRIARAVFLQPETDHLWTEFVAAVDSFDPGRLYVLIAGPMTDVPGALLANLGLIDWDMVLDFDCDTDTAGLARVAAPVITQRRLRHLVRLGDRPSLNVGRATYWYAARGLADMPSTVCEPTWLKWNSKYYADLQGQLHRLAAGSPSPCTIVCLWDDPEYVRSACTAISAVFGEKASYVFAASNTTPLASISEQFGGKVFCIDAHKLCTDLGEYIGAIAVTDGESADRQLPVREANPYTVPPQDAAWLAEELDVLYLSAGASAPEGREVGRDYLRGHEVTWYELGLHYDVDRDVTPKLLKQVQRDLMDRVTTRLNLFHAPGAGGTTVSRRILWDTHRDYPCVTIQRCRPNETTARLRYIFSKTNQTLLVVIEGADVKENEAEDLFNLCRSQQIPVVFLNVLRRFSSVQERDRTFYIACSLTDSEAPRFVHVYQRESSSRARLLQEIGQSADMRLRTPFYFGLAAFEHDFAGLPRYVEARLDGATSEQRDVMCFLALAHHYAQKPLNSQLFASVIHSSRDRRLNLESLLPTHMLELLVGDEDGNWRPAHDLIAEEIMHQVLCPDGEDRRAWREGLSTWGCRFAEFCRGDDPVPSDEIMETLGRCFVLRDNRDLLGTESAVTNKFSQWVEDTSPPGRLPLLQKLTELFPEEPHFWAHLGRFYSIELGDPAKAVDAVDHALYLSPEDPVLHHMKGMVLRKTTYERMDAALKDANTKQALDSVVEIAERSAAEFATAREYAPDTEHGYISHIQLITKVLDFAFRASGTNDRASFLTAQTTNLWVRESLDEAEDLLDQVRRLREGQEESEFEGRCRNEVQALYGRYDLALQGWDNLLGRPGVYKPPIRRQLVRTYLARRDRSWDLLDERDLRRIITLLEENILEEPNQDRNLMLWMQAIRRQPQLATLQSVIERVSHWRARSDTLEATFYLYVLHSLDAIEGSPLAALHAQEVLDDSRKKAKERRNRTVSLEWIGQGHGLGLLVHHSRLGKWDKDKDFWENAEVLGRISGRILSIAGPEAGQIELACGLKAFFVPGKSGPTVDGKRAGLVSGRDENKPVTAFLGFSYDGLRAWDVQVNE